MITNEVVTDQTQQTTARRIRLAGLMIDILQLPAIREYSTPARKFVKSIKPMVAMMLGKGVAEMLDVVLKPEVDTLELYRVLQLGNLTETDLDEMARFLMNAAIRLGNQPATDTPPATPATPADPS